MLPAPPPPPSGNVGPGWFADPWRQATYRWWDGHEWTGYVGRADQRRRPRLPPWLSVPVVICTVPVAIAVFALAVVSPEAVLLGLVPLVIVLPALWWLDRVEPEPLAMRIHSVLWGATVSVVVASIVNELAGAFVGTVFAAVIAAPLIEELMKGLGVYWAVRRRELDGPMDGVVYAGWVGIGFAVVEDFLYFATAETTDELIETFVLRALLTPFAHPLFTAWIGLAIGLAVAQRKPMFPTVLWGYGLAVVTHGIWNGALTLAGTTGSARIMLLAAALFIGFFIAVTLMLIMYRHQEQQEFNQLVPFLASRYGLTADEVRVFSDWGPMLRARRSLPRTERRHFDRVHAALARLATLHSREGPVDRVTEQRLAAQLYDVRATPPG